MSAPGARDAAVWVESESRSIAQYAKATRRGRCVLRSAHLTSSCPVYIWSAPNFLFCKLHCWAIFSPDHHLHFRLWNPGWTPLIHKSTMSPARASANSSTASTFHRIWEVRWDTYEWPSLTTPEHSKWLCVEKPRRGVKCERGSNVTELLNKNGALVQRRSASVISYPCARVSRVVFIGQLSHLTTGGFPSEHQTNIFSHCTWFSRCFAFYSLV